MKGLFRGLLAATLSLAFLSAEAFTSFGQERRDSVVYRQSDFLDSTLVGENIFSLLSHHGDSGGKVSVHQSQRILDAFGSYVASNSSRTSNGFRVRIFNDNRQTSRNDSETALERFKEMFPGVSAYRTYSNPFFRVTVGDFRTRSEAMQLLQRVKGTFPTAFIVKETINYPVVDRLHSYTIQTVNQE